MRSVAAGMRAACVLALLAPAAAGGREGPVAMHRIVLGECGEAVLDGLLARRAAERLWKLKAGSCAEQGYTLQQGERTLELPGVAALRGQLSLACGAGLDGRAEAVRQLARLAGLGELRELCSEAPATTSGVVLRRFKKPDLLSLVKSLAPSAALGLPGLPAFLGGPAAAPASREEAAPEQPCCQACEAPREKYYSVDAEHGHCGECCMEPFNFRIFKVFEPNLTKADGKTCASLGFPEFAKTVTHGMFPISMTLDEYSPAKKALPKGMKSGFKLADGLCGEVAINEKYYDYVSQVANLTSGFCKDVQYVEPEGAKNLTVPVLGQIIVHLYKKAGELDLLTVLRFAKAVALDEKVTFSRVVRGQCAQALVEPQMEQAVSGPLGLLGFARGSCLEAGYAKASGHESVELPAIGKVELSLFGEEAPEGAEVQVLV